VGEAANAAALRTVEPLERGGIHVRLTEKEEVSTWRSFLSSAERRKYYRLYRYLGTRYNR
jgi:hypothetical protein